MFGAHVFTGTVRKEEKNARGGFEEPPEGIETFVDFERSADFRQKLLENDVIIYDLMSNSFEEVDYVIKTLKTSDYAEEKTLVLLSSVMTWVNTPPKLDEEEKAEDDEEGGEGGAEEEASEEEPPSEEEEENKEGEEEGEEKEEEIDPATGEPVVIKDPKDFKEEDYYLRVPHEDFNSIKTLETTALSSVETQPKLKVHVLCSGIRYGNGERTFYDHFQKSWIQDPVELPTIGEGENLVPTIHVIDLARLVRRVVIENPKVHPYIFAIDKTRRPTQKRLITEVSKGMGTGKIASVPAESVSAAQGWKDQLTINLRMKASDAFRAIPLTAAQAELEPEDQEKLVAANKFPWHSKFGIRKNIRDLEGEFNTHRGLNPVKIFITGPPASGKTYYAQELARYYNIPRVHVRQLVDEVFRMAAIDEEAAGENKLINDCRTKLEDIRKEMEEKIIEEREGLEEPEGGWPDEIEIKDSDIRVPDDLLWEVLNIKLGENDCRNRGYILDGFPRKYKGAQNSFLKKEPQYGEDGELIEEEEPELEEGEEPSFDKHVKDTSIFPGSIIVLDGKDDDLIARVRELTEEQIAGTHYNVEDMQRRIRSYREANNSKVAEPAVQDFFKEQGIKFYKESIRTRTADALNGFKIYIERVSLFSLVMLLCLLIIVCLRTKNPTIT